MQQFSQEPKIYTIPQFISQEECQHIIELAKPKMQQSLVSDTKGGIVSKGRTGKNCWIQHNATQITSNIAKKISDEVGIPLSHAEAFQVIHYYETQEYRPHFDGWLHDGSDKSKRTMSNGGQRLITALVYLNEVSKGGGTQFTRIIDASGQRLTINPEPGKMLIFHNCKKNTNGRHILSEHAGMPVLEGEKWAFNLWFRELPRTENYAGFRDFSIENIGLVQHMTPVNANKNNMIVNSVEEMNQIATQQERIVANDDDKIIFYKNKISGNSLIDVVKHASLPETFTRNRRQCWIAKELISNFISQIEEIVGVKREFFENALFVDYETNAIHGSHYDAYDIEQDNGKKHTKVYGQRIKTITVFLSDFIVSFPRIKREFEVGFGNAIIYNNVLDTSSHYLQRDSNMIHSYKNINPDGGSLLHIYIREKNVNGERNSLLNTNQKERIVEETIIQNNNNVIDYKHALKCFYDYVKLNNAFPTITNNNNLFSSFSHNPKKNYQQALYCINN